MPMHELLMILAVLQAPVTGWFVYKRARQSKGALSGLFSGGGAALAALAAIAILAELSEPNAQRSIGSAAREAESPPERVSQQAAPESPTALAPAATPPDDGTAPVLQPFDALRGLRFGMHVSSLPTGYRQILVSGNDPADAKRFREFLEFAGMRETSCYERTGGESGLPGARIEKTRACFDVDKSVLVQAVVYFDKAIANSTLVMEVKRQIDKTVGSEGTPEADNGRFGYAKYQWRAAAGTEPVELTFWSVPVSTHFSQATGRLYKSGQISPIAAPPNAPVTQALQAETTRAPVPTDPVQRMLEAAAAVDASDHGCSYLRDEFLRWASIFRERASAGFPAHSSIHDAEQQIRINARCLPPNLRS